MKNSNEKDTYYKRNAVLIALAAVFTVFLLITGGYVTDGYVIKVNDVSGVRIKAPRQVENKIATEKKREEAAATVTDRFKKEESINDKINKNLTGFFQEMDLIRREKSDIFIPKRNGNAENEESGNSSADNSASGIESDVPVNETYPLSSNGSPEQKKNTQELFPKDSLVLSYISLEEAEFLIGLDMDAYNELKGSITDFVTNSMDAGIKEEGFAKTLVDLKGEFEKIYEGSELSQIGYDIASSFLEPNMVVDEEATERVRQEKRDEVAPVYYRKGQTIVEDGYPVTEEAYEALKSLGLISNGYSEKIIPIIGVVLIVFCIFAASCFYIFLYNEKLYKNKNETLLLFVLYIMISLFIRLFYAAFPNVFLPVLAFAMLVAVLLDNRLAIILNVGMTIITMWITNGSIETAVYFLIMGTVTALTSKYVSQRNNIYLIGLVISVASVVVNFAIILVSDKVLNTSVLVNMGYAFLNGFLTVVIAMGSLPFWEGIFGSITTIKLLDLTNPSNELLRRLTIEAPGTYHHSLIVANLAETAAYDIKADPNIARVGAYYHDIGKLKYPQYFSENQLGENLHDDMDPYSSVEIITAHVKIGLEMAEEKKLPKVVKDIIEQHHGDTMVKYFYHKAKKETPDLEINEDDFRYKNRRPQSKEAAVVMLADTVEAAVRSMISKSKGMDEVEEFVRQLIKDKLEDNQLIDSELTIKDIDTIASSFMRVFKGMYHERIPYPEVEAPKRMFIRKEAETEEKEC